jgi:hypothetical protein
VWANLASVEWPEGVEQVHPVAISEEATDAEEELDPELLLEIEPWDASES